MITAVVDQYRLLSARARLAACLRSEAAETFLELLLGALRIGLAVDPQLHRGVQDFDGRYRLATRDKAVDVALTFRHGHLDVGEDATGPFNATLWFRDERALMRFFAARNPDLFASLLNQDVVTEGNLNYIYRLAYLARHVQLEATGRV